VNLFRGDGRPLVIGHRGAAAVAPENTAESFAAAVAAGADAIELDVSRDLLIGHSPAELPPDPLSLDDALESLKPHGVALHLDVKLVGYEDAVVAAVHRHRVADRTYFSTAFAASGRRLAQLAPGLHVAIGYPRDRLGVSRLSWPAPLTASGTAALRAAMPARIPVLLRWARADTLSLHHTLCSRAAVATAHRLGAPVLAWTANDPAAIRRLAALGVDGIASDDPAKCLATLLEQ
jgi:glycerophosphoryl diester phosphodiesterase